MIRNFILGVLAALLFILSGVDAKAAVSCSLSATNVDFGEFQGLAATAAGALVLSCFGSGQTDYVITLTTGAAGTYNPRTMTSGTDRVAYNLFSESSLSSIWGNGVAGTVVVTGSVNNQSDHLVTTSIPIYARIPPQPLPTPANYADTITANLTYRGPNANTSFLVMAHVSPSCRISANDLAFSTYSQVQLDAQSALSVNCTNTTPWNVGLNQGTSAGATVTTRKMTRVGFGSPSLSYKLFRDTARTQNWGNSVGIDTMSGTATGNPQSVPVYGRIPASQSVLPGGYRDTITATLTF
jgi:spore coat protein U-like protein